MQLIPTYCYYLLQQIVTGDSSRQNWIVNAQVPLLVSVIELLGPFSKSHSCRPSKLVACFKLTIEGGTRLKNVSCLVLLIVVCTVLRADTKDATPL